MYSILSLTEGTPIGIINGGEFDGEILYVTESDSRDNQEFFLTDEGKIKPLHIKQANGYPNRIQISGASLCGKSFFARLIAEDYWEKYCQPSPHKKKGDICKIVLFTGIPRHKDNIFGGDGCEKKEHKVPDNRVTRDMCNNIIRIRCDESILEDPIELDELSNSLCIFDDIDRFPNKEVSLELNNLRDKIMTSGRHDNIDVISIGHILLNGKKTQNALTNAFQIVSFPHSGGRYQLIEYLKRYVSLPKEKCHHILGLPTRWLIINNANPNYIVHEKGALII